jgi:predicted nucleotidyltransferase
VAAVFVPAINKRKRIPEKAIQDVVRQIAEKFHPQKIILFGSYARGKPRPESDVDLLVVMETQLKETRQALLIDKSLDRDLFGLDLIVRTPSNLQERIALGDSFLKEIVSAGKVLYESPDR